MIRPDGGVLLDMRKRKLPQVIDEKTAPSWDRKAMRLQNGYDVVNDAGVINGRYTRCDSSTLKSCQCYGCTHEGKVPGLNAKIVDRR